jgi:diguanylate cyclase (GGDEF)-like protein
MTDPARHSRHESILVADAAPASSGQLVQALSRAGYAVSTVASGSAALLAVHTLRPDLVLLAVNLPDHSALSLCAAINADPATAEIPVILLADDPALVAHADHVGAVELLARSAPEHELLASVRAQLRAQRRLRGLGAANQALSRRVDELKRLTFQLQAELTAHREADELNRLLLSQERRRVQRLFALRAALTAIDDATDSDEAQATVVEQAVSLLGAARGALALAVGQNGMRLAAVSGLPHRLIGQLLAPGEGVVGMAAARGALIGSPGDEPAPSDAIFGPGAVVAAPLRVRDNLVGVVVVAGPLGGAFDSEDDQLLALFAQQAATALQNALLIAELGQLARSDALTGLFNRRHFFALAERELERVRRANGQLAVLMLDLDNFKTINDRFGHQAGDQALCAVAELLHLTLRSADVAARLGGEELVVLLPDADIVQATLAAQRLCRAIADLELRTEFGSLRFTVSVGVAALDEQSSSEPIDRLLARADQALYDAKAAGRNCVHCWQPPTPALLATPPTRSSAT